MDIEKLLPLSWKLPRGLKEAQVVRAEQSASILERKEAEQMVADKKELKIVDDGSTTSMQQLSLPDVC